MKICSVIFYMIMFSIFISCNSIGEHKVKIEHKTIGAEINTKSITYGIGEPKETYRSKEKWGDKKMTFNRYNHFSELEYGETLIEFIDSVTVVCTIHNPQSCGMGQIIYDTLYWNRQEEFLYLNISGTQIGTSNFFNSYKYWYYQADIYKFELEIR